MAERAEDIQAWLSTLPEGTLVGVAEGGLAIEAKNGDYFEIGMIPSGLDYEVRLTMSVTAEEPLLALRAFLADAADPAIQENLSFEVRKPGETDFITYDYEGEPAQAPPVPPACSPATASQSPADAPADTDLLEAASWVTRLFGTNSPEGIDDLKCAVRDLRDAVTRVRAAEQSE
jgi:hypothetical protein